MSKTHQKPTKGRRGVLTSPSSSWQYN